MEVAPAFRLCLDDKGEVATEVEGAVRMKWLIISRTTSQGATILPTGVLSRFMALGP